MIALQLSCSFHMQDQSGFLLLASSFDNGRISCSFSRSIYSDNVNEDRNLAEARYVFLASGSHRGRQIYYENNYTIIIYYLFIILLSLQKQIQLVAVRTSVFSFALLMPVMLYHWLSSLFSCILFPLYNNYIQVVQMLSLPFMMCSRWWTSLKVQLNQMLRRQPILQPRIEGNEPLILLQSKLAAVYADLIETYCIQIIYQAVSLQLFILC